MPGTAKSALPLSRRFRRSLFPVTRALPHAVTRCDVMQLSELQRRLLTAAMDVKQKSNDPQDATSLSRLIEPGWAAAAFALARALNDTAVLDGLYCCSVVLVKVPSQNWVEPISDILRDAMLPSGPVTHANEGRRRGGAAGITMLSAPTLNGAKEEIEVLRERNFLNALRARTTIVAVATEASEVLPREIAVEYFETTVIVEISNAVVDDCLMFYACGDRGSESVGAARLEPSHFCMAFGRQNSSAAFVVAVLRAALHKPKVQPAIRLMDLHGMAPVVAWTLTVAEDLRAYANSEISWANCAKGILISGPPGCGKTRASEAIADHLALDLISTSVASWMTFRDGSLGDFCKAVRNVFEEARRRAPVVLCIDECDALGSRSADGDAKEWWNVAVAAVLEQLDGIRGREGVVVMGLCNMPELIDPALTRAGRLENHIRVGYPDIDERSAVLRFCLGHDLPDIDLRAMSSQLPGRTQATLAKIVGDARRIARHAARPMRESDLAFALHSVSPPLKPAVFKRSCVHEAGHAVMAMLEHLPIDAITIGKAGLDNATAHTVVDPLLDEMGDLSSIRRYVRVLLAGRAAEALLIGIVSDGATEDLWIATTVIIRAIATAGLGAELRWRGVPKDRLHELPPEIAAPVETMLQEEFAVASRLLSNNIAVLRAVAELLEKENYVDGKRLMERFGVALQGLSGGPS